MLFKSMDDDAPIFRALLIASYSWQASWARTLLQTWEAQSIYIGAVRRLEFDLQAAPALDLELTSVAQRIHRMFLSRAIKL